MLADGPSTSPLGPVSSAYPNRWLWRLSPIAALCAGIYLVQVLLFTIPWFGPLAALFSVFLVWPVGLVALLYAGWRLRTHTVLALLAPLLAVLLLALLFVYPAPYNSTAKRSAHLLQFILVKHRLDSAYAAEKAQHPDATFVMIQTDAYFSADEGFALDESGGPRFVDATHMSICNPYTYNIYGPYYFFLDGC